MQWDFLYDNDVFLSWNAHKYRVKYELEQTAQSAGTAIISTSTESELSDNSLHWKNVWAETEEEEEYLSFFTIGSHDTDPVQSPTPTDRKRKSLTRFHGSSLICL